MFLLGLLASSIVERKAETEYVYKPRVALSEYEPRNILWGENFPREYQSYLQTADTDFRSEFNGNAPTDALARDPKMVILWAGYAFSKDYYTPRGHYYAIDLHRHPTPQPFLLCGDDRALRPRPRRRWFPPKLPRGGPVPRRRRRELRLHVTGVDSNDALGSGKDGGWPPPAPSARRRFVMTASVPPGQRRSNPF